MLWVCVASIFIRVSEERVKKVWVKLKMFSETYEVNTWQKNVANATTPRRPVEWTGMDNEQQQQKQYE